MLQIDIPLHYLENYKGDKEEIPYAMVWVDENTPLNFYIDPGSSMTIIKSEVLKYIPEFDFSSSKQDIELADGSIISEEKGTLPLLGIGGLVLHQVPVLISDTLLSKNQAISGLIGNDFLNRYTSYKIDREAERLTLEMKGDGSDK